MAFVLFLLISIAVGAYGGPAENYSQRRQSLRQSPQHAQLDYYLDQSEANFDHQNQKKASSNVNVAPSRLETLEPDSEVELLPGAQQPQQPPQQVPVSPNVPGLQPGQRVFIIHMPVPGYRPGGMGYQPVYVVGAAPNDNNNYAHNGYQNTVLLDPSGQVLSPFIGYRGVPQGSPHFTAHGTYALQQPYNFLYPGSGYQPLVVSSNHQNNAAFGGNFRGAIRLTPVPQQVYNRGPQQQAFENKSSNIEERSSKISGENDSRENYEEKQASNKTE